MATWSARPNNTLSRQLQSPAQDNRAKPAADSKWLPLGVFAVVEGDATSSDDIFQLAVNPQGIVRGNYNNVRTNQVESYFRISG